MKLFHRSRAALIPRDRDKDMKALLHYIGEYLDGEPGKRTAYWVLKYVNYLQKEKP